MKKYDTLLKKANQAGSMMIEALAMLTLISLVTPTLYKKSAERTTELQDINTASQVRTLTKAVDNYTLTNYQSLLEKLGHDASASLKITKDDLQGYLPYGYNFGAMKNFGEPAIIIKRQGDTASLTSFVVLPKNGDVNDYRASQIASMVGANGGYVTVDGANKTVAKGVGGVWSLGESDLEDMLGSSNVPARGSLVAASSEIINEASRAAFENSKYLQRTKTEHEEWRNTMMTDLYMGGVPDIMEGNGDIAYSKILGVDQLIIGDIATSGDANETASDFVVKAHGGKEGSAFIEGSLFALGNNFSVFSNGNSEPELNFANSLLKATKNHFSVNVTQGGTNDFIIATQNGSEPTATFNVPTVVDNTLETFGNTSVAGDVDASFMVGPQGKVMSADKYTINLQEGNVVIDNGLQAGTDSNVHIATNTVNIDGNTKIGTDDVAPLIEDLNTDLKLNVQGNTFVSGTLEAGEIDTRQSDIITLTAGGRENDYNKDENGNFVRWLNVDENGVIVKDIDATRANRMVIDENETTLKGPVFKDDANDLVQQGQMYIGTTDAGFQGIKNVDISTQTANYDNQDNSGLLKLQEGAIIAAGHAGTNNIVQIKAANTKIYGSDGTAAVDIRPGDKSNGERSLSTMVTDVDRFVVGKGDTQLLNVVSGENNTKLQGDAVAEIDPNTFVIWAQSKSGDVNNRVLEVNAKQGTPNDDGTLTSNASVYIRRGAVELESSSSTATPTGDGYAADEGVGYIEASRLVANNMQNDQVVAPYFSNSSSHDVNVRYDRYMVNPAYTSVMHDIKLTTRGGARLSDILPDFINKGIYIVNNTYQDGVDFNNLSVSVQNGAVTATNAHDIESNDKWASPFLGMVPAPQCPPGHARVITLTPASFQMAQAGDMIVGNDGRYYVSNEAHLNKLPDYDTSNSMVSTPQLQDMIINKGHEEQVNSNIHLYYLGMSPDTNVSDSHAPRYAAEKTAGSQAQAIPKPLYFQQSTWLKSKVIAYANSPCGQSLGENGACSNFMGWAAVMGFIYPYSLYGPIIDSLTTKTQDSLAGSQVYWNIFPVRAHSMEAYATVYCYFDRSNIFGSGNNGVYVDQYDQMRNFRNVDTKTNANTSNGGGSGSNADYIKRLNDPYLKYSDPW